MATYNLEDLLRSPYCWNSEKFIRFWYACDDYCIRNLDNYKVWKPLINERAKNRNIWNGKQNWEIVLGSDYDHLCTDRNGVKVSYQTKFVSKLLRIIRNNHQHRDECSPFKRNYFNWHNWCFGKWVCDENKFVGYWISKFPNFVPFIWEEFRCFTDFWENKDSTQISPVYSKSNPDLFATDTSAEFFIRKLSSACDHFQDNGNYYKRYILQSSSTSQRWTVEFGTLSAVIIKEILNGCIAVAFEISGNSLKVRHYKVQGTYDELNHGVRPSPSSIPVEVFVVCQSFQDSQVVAKNASFRNTTNCIIHIFTSNIPTDENMNEVSDTVNKFAEIENLSVGELPVTVSDLSVQCQNALRFGNAFKLDFGNQLFSIKDVFPNELPECLKGSTLNKLLKEKTIHLFDNRTIESNNSSNALFHREGLTQCFHNSGNGFNILYGRPYIGKSFAARHYTKSTQELTFITNYRSHTPADRCNSLFWHFTKGDSLSSAVLDALLNAKNILVTFIVDGAFDEKLLLKNNSVETNSLQWLSSKIQEFVQQYDNIKCWLILRPYCAHTVKSKLDIQNFKYEITETQAKLVIEKLTQKRRAMNGTSLKPSTLNKCLLKNLENKFELSPIILSGLLKLVETSEFSENTQATDFTRQILLSEMAEVVTEAYFQHTSQNLANVAQPNKKIFQYMHFKLALEWLRNSFDEHKQHIEELEEQINMFLDNLEDDLSNDKSFVLDYGLVKAESAEEFQFYDASVPFYFFALGFLVVRPYQQNYTLWRTLLEFMNLRTDICTYFRNVMQIFHELGRKTEYLERYKKIIVSNVRHL